MVKQLSEMTPLQALEGLALDTKGQSDTPLSKLFLILQEKLKEKDPIFAIDAAEEIINLLGINQKHRYTLSTYIQSHAVSGIHEVHQMPLDVALNLVYEEPYEIERKYSRGGVNSRSGILFHSKENLIDFIRNNTSKEERVYINCNF